MLTSGFRSRVVSWVAAALCTAAVTGPAASQTLASLPKPGTIGQIEPTGRARPVQAWVGFCERYPGSARLTSHSPG